SFSALPRRPAATLFPYTTLFRSAAPRRGGCAAGSHLALCRACDGERGRGGAGAEDRRIDGCARAQRPVKALWAETRQTEETPHEDRKSTRLNSSHVKISYAVFCL